MNGSEDDRPRQPQGGNSGESTKFLWELNLTKEKGPPFTSPKLRKETALGNDGAAVAKAFKAVHTLT
jgi:hypothetical protein